MEYKITNAKPLYDREGNFVTYRTSEDIRDIEFWAKDVVSKLYDEITTPDFEELVLLDFHKNITFKVINTRGDYIFHVSYGIDTTATLEEKTHFAICLQQATQVMLSLQYEYYLNEQED